MKYHIMTPYIAWLYHGFNRQHMTFCGMKNLSNQTEPDQTKQKTPTYGTISAWHFNGSNSQHRSLCWMQKGSARTVGPFFLCLEVTALYGSCNGERLVPVRNTITLPWPHLFRKIFRKTQEHLFFSQVLLPHSFKMQNKNWVHFRNANSGTSSPASTWCD